MIGQGAVGRKKRKANERVDCGFGEGVESFGVSHKLGKSEGGPFNASG